MMDPLSITVGTVSLLTGVIKIARDIKDVAEKCQDAPNTISQVVGDVETINTLLLEVQDILSGDSDVNSNLSGGFSRAMLDCQETLRCIQSEYDQLQNSRDMATRLLFLWKDDKMKALLERLEAQKSTLGLYMSLYIAKCCRVTEQSRMPNQQTLLPTEEDLSNLLPRYPETHKALQSVDEESAMSILDQDSYQPPDEPSWIRELVGSKVYSRAYMQQLNSKQSTKEAASEHGSESTTTLRIEAEKSKRAYSSVTGTPERQRGDETHISNGKASNEAQSNASRSSTLTQIHQRGFATTYSSPDVVESLPIFQIMDASHLPWGFVVRKPASAEDLKNFTWDHDTKLFWPDDHFHYYDRVRERFGDGEKGYVMIGAEMPAKLDKSGAKRRVIIRKDAPTGLTDHVRSLLSRNSAPKRVAARVIKVPFGRARHGPAIELQRLLASLGRKIEIGNTRLLKGACYRYEAALEYILVQVRLCSPTYFLPTTWRVRCLDDAIAICLQDLVYSHSPTDDERQLMGIQPMGMRWGSIM